MEVIMLAKCANPECSVVFRSQGSGKLFRMPSQYSCARADHSSAPPMAEPMQHFWLCSDCARSMTLAVERNGRVVVMRRKFLEPYREAFGRVRHVPEISPAQLPAFI
jgi:hypothetical protein